jgi:aryl-alcohol dehydrogenase-like predicted oxidoreductase
MDYTHLGRSGLSVSRLCLGTMNFGPQTDESTSFEIMDAAQAAGLNFFDTANVYGSKLARGATESILGRYFAQGGDRRENTVLATKVYGNMSDRPNDGKLSALNIRRSLDESLKRLQTDYVDLFQFHHVDRDTPWDEIWQAMETAVAQGKILYAGSSNFAGWHIATGQAEARRRNFTGLVSEQSLYNLLKRDIEREVIPAAQANGMGILPWSPLEGGLLGGVLQKQSDTGRRVSEDAAAKIEKHRPALEAYEAFCAELGHKPGDVGLAWLMHQSAVTAPIIGPRTMEQLKAGLRALTVELDQAALTRLDEIFPGYKTAPEDYAW